MACSLMIFGDRVSYPSGISKGDILTIYPPMRQADLGTREQPPRFVRVNITDRVMSQILQYQAPWSIDIDWQQLSHDVPTDTYVVRASSPMVAAADNVGGATDRGRLRRDQIESWIQGWGGSVVGVAPNAIDLSLPIYGAMKSRGFFHYPQSLLDLAAWSEVYDQGTGLHTVTCNYAGVQASPDNLEKRVRNLGLTVVDHVLDEITFSGDRSIIFPEIKHEVRDKIAGRVQTSGNFLRYAITPAQVDQILVAGGEVDRTFAQVTAEITDKLA